MHLLIRYAWPVITFLPMKENYSQSQLLSSCMCCQMSHHTKDNYFSVLTKFLLALTYK